MTETKTDYPTPENPLLVPCECRGCGALYRVVCTGYHRPNDAWCPKCGSYVEEVSPDRTDWLDSSYLDGEALTEDGVKPPATERAPTLMLPRTTEANILALRRAQYALRIATALEQYATWGEDDSVLPEAAEWRERARRDGILPTVTPPQVARTERLRSAEG